MIAANGMKLRHGEKVRNELSAGMAVQGLEPVQAASYASAVAALPERLRQTFGVAVAQLAGPEKQTLVAAMGAMGPVGVSRLAMQMAAGGAAELPAPGAAMPQIAAAAPEPPSSRAGADAGAEAGVLQSAVDNATVDSEVLAMLAALPASIKKQPRAQRAVVRAWPRHVSCGHAPTSKSTAVRLAYRVQ